MENSEITDTQQSKILRLEFSLADVKKNPAEFLDKFTQLKSDYTSLQTDYSHLQSNYTRLETKNTDNEAENRQLREKIEELQAQIGKNSRNSSLPPSSDGYRKKPTPMNKRKRGERKPGGQTGHKGHTLEFSEHPDEVVEHKPETCAICGGKLDADHMEKIAARQVHDLPELPQKLVVEHQKFSCKCKSCGSTTHAEFPSHIKAPTQYGPNITFCILYLYAEQYFSINRTKQLLKEFSIWRFQQAPSSQ